MLFSQTLIIELCLLPLALASRAQIREYVSKQTSHYSSNTSPADLPDSVAKSNASDSSYTSKSSKPSHPHIALTNWAGAIIQQPPPNGVFTGATGKLKVPKPTVPVGTGSSSSSNSSMYAAASWVGLDGDDNNPALLQAGVAYSVSGSRSMSYGVETHEAFAWYQWLPGPSFNFTNVTVSIGDEVKLAVTRLSSTSASFYIENETTGKSQNLSFAAPNSNFTIVGSTAEWVVEEYSENGMVPLADFDKVTFTNCRANTSSHSKPWVGLKNASTISLQQQSGKVLATAEILGTSGVRVTYGPGSGSSSYGSGTGVSSLKSSNSNSNDTSLYVTGVSSNSTGSGTGSGSGTGTGTSPGYVNYPNTAPGSGGYRPPKNMQTYGTTSNKQGSSSTSGGGYGKDKDKYPMYGAISSVNSTSNPGHQAKPGYVANTGPEKFTQVKQAAQPKQYGAS